MSERESSHDFLNPLELSPEKQRELAARATLHPDTEIIRRITQALQNKGRVSFERDREDGNTEIVTAWITGFTGEHIDTTMVRFYENGVEKHKGIRTADLFKD